MEQAARNALANAPSSYLRSAMNQPVQWLPWGPEAFARAAAEDKPVLLDVGAIWCQWCRVMSRESYDDSAIAELINEHYIAIKVDRDERPDIDARYQAAVSAISGQGGWPLTVFLTPEGKPYFGGTYFPVKERYGQPGFERVLKTMAASFYEQRAAVEESASSVMDAIEYGENYAGPPGDLRQSGAASLLLDKLVDAALQQFDPQHGGFGAQPKFPNAAALDLLIAAALHARPDAEKARQAALTTLHAMAQGGICDQLEGGFHRYSTDARWVVPRFEKTLYDNAALLRTYSCAAHEFDDAECREAAVKLLNWIGSTLFDHEYGGFFSLQAADAPTAVEGSYYTWTRAEATAVLTDTELRLAEVYFDLGAMGDLPHDPARNVLFRPVSMVGAALQVGIDPEVAGPVLQRVVDKLRARRAERPTPVVDRAVYTVWNGMAISAFVQAARVLERPDALACAQRSLDRVLAAACSQGSVSHVVAYADGTQPATEMPGMLDDHVALAHACLDMWEANRVATYLHTAEQIADVLLLRFHDAERGGFFDLATNTAERLGALCARRRPIQDAPTPAGNPSAAALLLRMYAITRNQQFYQVAHKTLESFAAVVEHLGLYAATFGLALAQLASSEACTESGNGELGPKSSF